MTKTMNIPETRKTRSSQDVPQHKEDCISSPEQSSTIVQPLSKCLLLSYLLWKDQVITTNGYGVLKEHLLHADAAAHEHMSGCFETQKYSRNQQPFLDLIEAIIAKALHSHYDHLYRSYSTTVAKHVSKRERREKHLSSNRSLIYGEIEYEAFRRILDRIHVWSQTSISERQKWTFYDLGSGTGRAVVLARLIGNYRSCIGLEILESLYGLSTLVQHEYERDIHPKLQQQVRGESQTNDDLEDHSGLAFHHVSMTDFDWSDGQICFANSTCFDDALFQHMTTQAEKLQSNSWFITFTRRLVSPVFEMIHMEKLDMSWGEATVYLHRRV